MKTRTLLFLSLSLFVISSLSAQAKFPDTPSAKQLSGWFTAFNSGDRATFLAFIQKNRPSAVERVDDTMQFRDMTGGFDLRKVEECGPTKCAAIAQEHSGDQFARFTIEVDSAEPYIIKDLQVRAIPRPAEYAMPRLTESEAIAALKAKLDSATAEDKFAGTVLIAKNGKPIFSNAYGLADRSKKIPNTLSTKFRMGSMNKMFTATAVLQLVQAGKINLNDPIGKYLPDYPNKDVATKVTVHHILTHTGGTGDIFGPEFDKHRLELKTLQDYVNLYGSRALEFEPGTRWEYSNYGMLLAGVLVEKVSGQDYYTYVREHIFKPAGMKNTDSLPESQTVEGRSVGYMKEDPAKPWAANDDTLPYRGTSAGGGYTTVEDLLAFANALQGNKLLDAKHTALLTTGHESTSRGSTKYAYGFMEDVSEDGVRSFGHGGGAPGMNGELRIIPQSGYVIAILSNLDPPAASRMSDFLEIRLPKN